MWFVCVYNCLRRLFYDDFLGSAVGVADDYGLAAYGFNEADAPKVVVAIDFLSRLGRILPLSHLAALADSSPSRGAFSQANSKNPPLAGEAPDRAEG